MRKSSSGQHWVTRKSSAVLLAGHRSQAQLTISTTLADLKGSVHQSLVCDDYNEYIYKKKWKLFQPCLGVAELYVLRKDNIVTLTKFGLI